VVVIHAGLLRVGESGIVKVTILPGTSPAFCPLGDLSFLSSLDII
jgi:hypothetical protein